MRALFFDRALPRQLFEHIRRRITEQFDHAQYQNSFWFPLNAPPRLDIEYAIVSLRRLLPTLSDVAGAEWWVPALESGHGMEWHCDCDRIVFTRERRFVRPLLSTVLYLTASGGPTLVVDEVATDHKVRRPRGERGCLAFAPMPNRYLVFPGDRIHAVASSDDGQTRITVAINWWSHKPSAPLCIEPAYGSRGAEEIATPSDFVTAGEETRPLVPLQLSPDELAALPHNRFCPVFPRSKLSAAE